MEAGSIIALVGLGITLICVSAAAVFTMVRYMSGSFQRVHVRFDDLIEKGNTRHMQAVERISDVDGRLKTVESKLTDHITNDANWQQKQGA